jgi:hypothetical protein
MFFLDTDRLRGLGEAGREGAWILPTNWHTVANGKIERRDSFAHLLAEIENRAPAPELLIEVEQAKSDLAGLARFQNENFRRRDIDPIQIGQAGHRAMLKCDNQLQRGLKLGHLKTASRLQLARIKAGNHWQRFGRTGLTGTLAHVQWQDDIPIGIELEAGRLETSACALTRDVYLRDRFAFYYADPQRTRQNPFD